MSQTNFEGENKGVQVLENHGTLHANFYHLYPATEYNFWQHLSAIVQLEDKSTLGRRKGLPAKGTCGWLFDTKELSSWLGSRPTVGPESQEGQILWLYGNPGIGKSVMALSLVEKMLEDPDKYPGTLAYFFCDSGDSVRKTAISIVQGLIYQLLKKHRKLRGFGSEKYEECGSWLFTSFDLLWETFMDMMADMSTGRKFIIIDALDECDQDSQATLLEKLGKKQVLPSNFRILITSRPLASIRESLQDFPNRDLASFPERLNDINTFIDEKVEYLAKKKHYPDLKKLQAKGILRDKAEGTFLWIGLACKQLDGVVASQAITTLETIPKTLNAIYTSLLDMAAKDDGASVDDMQRILSCVTVCYRPLTVLELSEACQLHPEQDYKIRIQFTWESIESCRSLIIVQDEKVLLLHPSVKDYLLGVGSNNCIEVSKAHAQMAYRCACILDEKLHNTNRPENQERDDGLFNYSANYWISHTLHGATPELDFLQLAAKLCEREALMWTQFVEDRFRYAIHEDEPLPFFWAARWGLVDVADLMLQDGKYQIQINDDILEKAAAHHHGEDTVMRLLFKHKGKEIRITDKVLQNAAANFTSGNSITRLLLELRGDEIKITDKVIQAAVANSNHGLEILKLLLNGKKENIKVTANVLLMAAESLDDGCEMIGLLLPHRRNDTMTPCLGRAIWKRSILEKEAIRQLLLPYIARFNQRHRHDQRNCRSLGRKQRKKKRYMRFAKMTRYGEGRNTGKSRQLGFCKYCTAKDFQGVYCIPYYKFVSYLS